MLRVHGNNLRAVLFRLCHHQLTGADQRLLVGKADALAGPDGRQRGLQPHHAHYGGDDTVHLHQRCRLFQPPVSVTHADIAVFAQQSFQGNGRFLGGHHRQLRRKLPALLQHPIHIGAGSQRRHTDTCHAANDIQRLSADGTGGA